MISSQPLEIKSTHEDGVVDWAIIGGGPAGLAGALALSNKPKVGKITVVEPYFDEYTRSGNYNSTVFAELRRMLGLTLDEMRPSSAYQIKEAERLLIKQIRKSNKIELVRGRFVTYSHQGVHVLCQSEGKDIERIIPCNILLDCSGQRQVVLNEANRLHPNNSIFNRQVIRNVDHARHLHTIIWVDREQEDLFSGKSLDYSEFLDRVKAKEELKKFGWSHWRSPKCYIHAVHKTRSIAASRKSKFKYHFYSEAPAELKENEIIPWIKTNIVIKNGLSFDVIDKINIVLKHKSKKNPVRKKQYDIYDSIPSFTVPFHYVEPRHASMVLVHLGDASFNTFFHFGLGLTRTVLQIEAFISNIKVAQNGAVSIDFSAFKEWSERSLKEHVNKVDVFCDSYQKKLAADEISKDEAVNALYALGLAHLEKYSANNNENANAIFDQYDMQSFEVMLDKSIDELILAWKWAAADNLIKVNIEKALLSMAKHCEHFADYVGERSIGQMALKYYDKALEIYSYMPAIYGDEISRVHLKRAPVKISIYVEDDYDPGPFGPTSYFHDTISADLVDLAKQNKVTEYKDSIIALFKENTISLVCAIKLNQLLPENKTIKSIRVNDLKQEIDKYHEEKGKWRKRFNTSTQTISDYTLLYDIAIKNNWTSIDESQIKLCLHARAKRDLFSFIRSGSHLKRNSYAFFNVVSDMKIDSLSQTEIFLRNIKNRIG